MKSQHKKACLLLFVFLSASFSTGMAQIARSSYFMKTSNSRHYMNPALRPEQGYIGFPGLGNVYADARTNTYNLNHLTFDKGLENRVSFLSPLVGNDEFLNDISANNYLSAETHLAILSAGWYCGEIFWDVSFNIKAYGLANITKAAFELAKIGFSETQQTPYNIANTNLTAQGFAELGLGYSRPFLDNSLVVGVRAKFLMGLADVDFNIDDLTVNGGPDYWRTKSAATLRITAPGITAKYKTNDNNEEVLDGFDYNESIDFAGYGLGIDIGGDYKFDKLAENFGGVAETIFKRLRVTAALTDIGFISWKKKSSLVFTSPETESYFSPSTNLSDENSSLEDALNAFTDDMENALKLQGEENMSRTTGLNVGLNAGLEYEIMKNKLTAGFLFANRFGKYFNMSEITLSANYRPCNWFAASIAHSFLYNAFNRFGLAIHLAPSRGFNFFLATDYIPPRVNSDFIPTTSKAINVQVGMSIPIGKRRIRN